MKNKNTKRVQKRAPITKTHGTHSSKDSLRFIPLGGFEEIGRNMMLLEYKDEILIVDAGLQFPEEETP